MWQLLPVDCGGAPPNELRVRDGDPTERSALTHVALSFG